MEQLRIWLHNIVVIFFLATLAELILPESKFRPYVRLVLSLTMMLMVLQPVVQLVRGSEDVFQDLLMYNQWVQHEEKRTSTRIQALNQEKWAIEVYKQQLTEQIASDVEAVTGHNIESIFVEVETDHKSPDFGMPKSISITFKASHSTSDSIEITPVIIDIGRPASKKESSTDLSEEEQQLDSKIKSLLRNKYGIYPDQVQVDFVK